MVSREDELVKELNVLVDESKAQESKENSSYLSPAILFNICMLLGGKYLTDDDSSADSIFLKARQIAEKNNIHPQYVQQTIGFSDSFSIKYHDINMPNTERLGEGSFGTVSKATWKNRSVAVKQLSKPDDKAFKCETGILKKIMQLGLSNVVHYYGSYIINNSSNYIVMECVPNSLPTLLMSKLILPLSACYKIMRGITQGVVGLQDADMVHGDIKIENILIDDAMEAKLCDLGSAIVSGSKKSTDTTYPAPEVIMGQPYTSKSEIYSLGVTFWRIITAGKSFIPRVKVLTGQRASIPLNCDPQLAKLITSCWAQHPVMRPTANEVLKEVDNLIERTSKPNIS